MRGGGLAWGRPGQGVDHRLDGDRQNEAQVRTLERFTPASQDYHPPVPVAAGTVIDRRTILDGVALAEGAKVTVVTRGADEGFTLTGHRSNPRATVACQDVASKQIKDLARWVSNFGGLFALHDVIPSRADQ